MPCCLRPWTTTTPSGRRDRSFPVLSTPTSWKRSSQLPGPRPLVNQILQHPLLLFLHLCLHHPHSYLVRQSEYICTNTFIHPVTLFDDVFSSDREDSPELPPPPGVSDNRQCVLCLKYGDENTNVSQKSAWALFNTQKSFFVSLVTCLLVSGGGQVVVHRAEWMDPCKLRPVVCRGVWGWWRLFEECSYGCSQGKTAGKTLCPSQVPTLFSVCICWTDIYNLLCFVFSTVRSVRSQGLQLAAASPLAQVTTTSCAPVSATVSSWRTKKSIVQSTRTSSREK